MSRDGLITWIIGSLAALLAGFVFYTQFMPEPFQLSQANGAETASSPGDVPPGMERAIFAGGCFWCVESAFDKVPGVTRTISGFTGGTVANPTYRQVGQGGTGHTEAVEVIFDPKVVSYEKLLFVFWRNIDLTDAGGQFCDRGPEYRTGIFVVNAGQRRLAEASKAALVASGRFKQPIVTPIEDAGPFYAAEDYHQGYHQRNPVKYQTYRFGCGRDQRLDALWGNEARGGAH